MYTICPGGERARKGDLKNKWELTGRACSQADTESVCANVDETALRTGRVSEAEASFSAFRVVPPGGYSQCGLPDGGVRSESCVSRAEHGRRLSHGGAPRVLKQRRGAGSQQPRREWPPPGGPPRPLPAGGRARARRPPASGDGTALAVTAAVGTVHLSGEGWFLSQHMRKTLHELIGLAFLGDQRSIYF